MGGEHDDGSPLEAEPGWNQLGHERPVILAQWLQQLQIVGRGGQEARADALRLAISIEEGENVRGDLSSGPLWKLHPFHLACLLQTLKAAIQHGSQQRLLGRKVIEQPTLADAGAAATASRVMWAAPTSTTTAWAASTMRSRELRRGHIE